MRYNKKAIYIIFLILAGTAQAQDLSTTARQMKEQGLVNIHDLSPDIPVSLMYARADNFTGEVLYKDLKEAFLHPKAAKALAKAQNILKETHPHLTLKVYDAARPMHIQQRMWQVVAGTPKSIYVSNPKNGGGMHNYGMAVDVTLAKVNGDSIPMGTLIDHLGKESHIDKETEMVKKGQLTKEAAENRLLLRRVMKQAGFKPLRTEWWHFNLISRAQAKAYYKPIK